MGHRSPTDGVCNKRRRRPGHTVATLPKHPNIKFLWAKSGAKSRYTLQSGPWSGWEGSYQQTSRIGPNSTVPRGFPPRRSHSFSSPSRFPFSTVTVAWHGITVTFICLWAGGWQRIWERPVSIPAMALGWLEPDPIESGRRTCQWVPRGRDWRGAS
jgi:hypothetical protein